MKKTLALLLLLTMCLSLVACGGNTPAQSPTIEQAPSSPWIIQKTVDEFGDVTEDSISVMEAPIVGDFSNTATSSSELGGCIRFVKKPNSEHYIVQFVLLEYGKTPAVHYSRDALSLKIKVGDQTASCTPVADDEPNGSIYLGTKAFDWTGDMLFNLLYTGQDIRCIMNIGSSKYNFSLESGNFTNVCEALDYTFAPGQLTAKEAVQIFVSEEASYYSYAVNYFAGNIDSIELVETDEIETVLNGSFIKMEITTSAYPYWRMKNYENGKHEQIAYLRPESYGHTFEKSDLGNAKAYTVKDNTVIEDSEYQIRRLSSDVFVTYKADDNGNFIVPSYLMIRYDSPVNSTHDVYDKMLPHIVDNLIPNI